METQKSFVLFMLLLLALPTAFARTDAKLISPNTGWAVKDKSIYWTTDNGARWKEVGPNVGPEEVLEDVNFIDSQNGWALISWNGPTSLRQFRVAHTNSGGTTWQSGNAKPSAKFETDYSGGWVRFCDARRGWLLLVFSTSQNFAAGVLMATTDGGATWSTIAQPPTVGDLVFVNEGDGWLAGGVGGSDLYQTHDGGRTWLRRYVKRPAGIKGASMDLYDIPTFADSSHGVLPVTYADDYGEPLSIIPFVTSDGGKTFNARGQLDGLSGYADRRPVPSGVFSLSLVAARSAGAAGKLDFISAQGVHESGGLIGRPLEKISFANRLEGWVQTEGGVLYATTDGGEKWAEITPSVQPKTSARAGGATGMHFASPIISPVSLTQGSG